MNKQKIVIIVGPTAVGKTALSVEVAGLFDGEIVSADSIQIYKGLDIGSAKVTKEEMHDIKHHLINIARPTDEYSAGQYVKDASRAIDEIISKGKLPIIVGGTGMYVQSLLFEPGVTCGKDENYRKELESLAQKNGKDYLYKMLEEIDPESAALIHPNHISRIVRALEIYHVSGKKKSEQKSELEPRYDYLLIGLTSERETLYNRINLRVDKMLEMGLEKEVQNLINMGISESNQCMQGIGYKETYDYLKNRKNRVEFIEKLKQNSRNYAKRQFTWFKKMPGIIWKTYDQKDEIIELIKEFINEKK